MYKVGQKFKTNWRPERFGGHVLIIDKITAGAYPYSVRVVSAGTGIEYVGSCHLWQDGGNGDMQIINEDNLENMSIIQKIKLLAKGEPEKSNIQAGLRTVNDEFTPEGKEAFLEFLYQQHKDEFKTEVAEPLLAETKKD